ncbi:MAG: hypothetical protein ACLRX3_09670 [Subdoligranulum sp.]
MLTNKEIEVLCYCRGCLNRKCGLDLERSDIKHLKMQKNIIRKIIDNDLVEELGYTVCFETIE